MCVCALVCWCRCSFFMCVYQCSLFSIEIHMCGGTEVFRESDTARVDRNHSHLLLRVNE